MPTNLAEAPTIEERVAFGRRINRVENGAIVPFPADWDPAWRPSCMAPGAASHISRLQSEGYQTTEAYWYTDPSGCMIAGALRLDHESKRKVVLPLRSSGVIGANPRLEFKAIDPLRPLYNLRQLTERPGAPVLLVEGEKTAEASAKRSLLHVTTTWPGGAQGVLLADVRPLIGRSVVIWPDNDEDGYTAAYKLGQVLEEIGATSVSVVRVPEFFPPKWDLADPLPEWPHV